MFTVYLAILLGLNLQTLNELTDFMIVNNEFIIAISINCVLASLKKVIMFDVVAPVIWIFFHVKF